ncbi:MAG: hypothetical protein HFK05_01895 [Clostridia bacterium]|nr:hypothetical protein [Clostridia bacterium]
MDYKSEIEKLVECTSALTKTPLMLGKDFEVVYQPKDHIPYALPKDKMAVYSFVYNNEFLKIGRAFKRSKARFQSHHYYIKSAKSTLANSLLKDPQMSNLFTAQNITQWIKSNCERFDILIDAKFGKLTLNFIEGLMHHQYNPRYEG